MPRMARQKRPEAIYHIICRSLSEANLFRDDDDKNEYLKILKTQIGKYKCKIYAYCLMDTHFHMHFDPKGFDVSTFMHSVNSSYVKYYNRKHARHGPLFQDRFESRIIDNDRYALTVSAYIHNNVKDIKDYAGKEHMYPYSSYGIYLGIRKDTLGLIDMSFIRSLFGNTDRRTFIRQYGEFVTRRRGAEHTDDTDVNVSNMVEHEYQSGRNIIFRDKLPSQVVSYISDRIVGNCKSGTPISTYRNKDHMAFCVYSLRVLCGLRYKEICQHIYNITISGCAILFNRGYRLASINKEYATVFDQLITLKAG
jgi:REP element-mobilizing transposase RayT